MQYYWIATPEICHNSPERFTPAFLAVFAPPPKPPKAAMLPPLKREAETASFFVNPLFAGGPATGV
jgi:hypothetical protein